MKKNPSIHPSPQKQGHPLHQAFSLIAIDIDLPLQLQIGSKPPLKIEKRRNQGHVSCVSPPIGKNLNKKQNKPIPEA